MEQHQSFLMLDALIQLILHRNTNQVCPPPKKNAHRKATLAIRNSHFPLKHTTSIGFSPTLSMEEHHTTHKRSPIPSSLVSLTTQNRSQVSKDKLKW